MVIAFGPLLDEQKHFDTNEGEGTMQEKGIIEGIDRIAEGLKLFVSGIVRFQEGLAAMQDVARDSDEPCYAVATAHGEQGDDR